MQAGLSKGGIKHVGAYLREAFATVLHSSVTDSGSIQPPEARQSGPL